MNKRHVLITGGTGLVGSYLRDFLKRKGHKVALLTRKKKEGILSYEWDYKENIFEAGAVHDADYIIHLAGENIGNGKWTPEKKHEILDTRIQTTKALYDQLNIVPHQVKAVICASATGYYGLKNGGKLLHEDDNAGNDFLATVVSKWEAEQQKIADLKIRTVTLRFGMVLSYEGGALSEMTKPILKGLGAPLGSGKQFQSWIHIEDLCKVIWKSIENKTFNGVYNAVAPQHITNKTLMKRIAQALGKPFFLPAVPSFVMRLILGEKADIVLGSQNVSPKKLLDTGFEFDYPTIQEALEDLL